jgi:Hsp70 protein/TIR domain
VRIFSCYSRSDRAAVARIHRALVDAGHQGWFDAFIMPGDDWQRRLRAEIVACDVFLYTVSPASVVSDWCTWELSVAVEEGKPIVPAILEADTPLPAAVAHLQFADLTSEDAEDSIQRLLGGISAISVARGPIPAVPGAPLGVPAHVAWSNPAGGVSASSATGVVDDVFEEWDAGGDGVPAGSGRFIGIDFGTVSSIASVVECGRSCPIPNGAGHYATPSAVGVGGDGAVVVGEAARQLALVAPHRVEMYPKRLLGTRRQLHVDGIGYSAARLTSLVLDRWRRDAAAYLGDAVEGAVITAPATFGRAEIADLVDAARIAHLPLLRVFSEPTAACFAYDLDPDDDAVVVVFDLGGGTFDVSVVEVGDGIWEVRSVVGDARLGGMDYDQALSEFCLAEFLATPGRLGAPTGRSVVPRRRWPPRCGSPCAGRSR